MTQVLKVYSPGVGQHISEAVKSLLELAPSTMQFNRVTVNCSVGDTQEEVEKRFYDGMAEAAKAYEDSPEGARAIKQRKATVRRYQKEIDGLMSELQDINLSEAETAIKWLRRFSEPADDIGVEVPCDLVITAFEAAGWIIDDCVGHSEVATDRTVYARWLIGQAMAGIKGHGAPHPVFESFAERWMEMK